LAIAWTDLTLRPDAAVIDALREHWAWMLGSVIGDVFVEMASGDVWWLSTATGSLEQVATSKDQFIDLLNTEQINEWFLPGLVEALRDHGKVLASGQIYSFKVFPVFAEGAFSVENMHVVTAEGHFAVSGGLHESIRQLPDGQRVPG
jgi:hypothetical protein